MGDIYTNPPQSRNEAILRATIDGTEYEAPPQSRMEDLLVELKAAIEQGGGIGSYNDLNNKPQINGVTLQGDKSISDLFDGKVDIGVGTVEESGYAELKDENGDRIFRASSANGGASVESGALIGQPGALVLYNGEGGLSSVRPKSGVSLVDVDLPAENGTLALDSQIASSQTPAKAAVVTVPDAAPINAEDITVDITPVQDLHGYDRPWAGGAGKNKLPMTVEGIKAANTSGTWNGNVYSINNGTFEILVDSNNNVVGIKVNGTFSAQLEFYYSEVMNNSFVGMKLNGNPSSAGHDDYIQMITYLNASGKWQKEAYQNKGADLVIADYAKLTVVFLVKRGKTVNNLIVNPMIRLATETDATFAPYSNICPIQGRAGAELDRVGKNKLDVPDGSISQEGYIFSFSNLNLPAGGYTLNLKKTATAVNLSFAVVTGATTPINTSISLPYSFEVMDTITEMRLYCSNATDYSEVQLESGTTSTAYEPYQGQQYTADFGETVYGGKWHVTDGGTDKTHANIANYNGETINEPWLSSLDEYSPGATPTTGAQVVYPLTTPTAISTPKQNVPMLQGINTVYADCGDTSLKYQPDNVIGELKGMIQEVESELDKLDKAYMTSDTFSEMGIDGEYQITRIGNEIHVAAVIDDASIATQTGSVYLIADLPDEFKCNPSYGAVLALRHSSGTGKIEFKLNPAITQSFYIYVEEVNTTSGVWFPIYDVPGKAL